MLIAKDTSYKFQQQDRYTWHLTDRNTEWHRLTVAPTKPTNTQSFPGSSARTYRHGAYDHDISVGDSHRAKHWRGYGHQVLGWNVSTFIGLPVKSTGTDMHKKEGRVGLGCQVPPSPNHLTKAQSLPSVCTQAYLKAFQTVRYSVMRKLLCVYTKAGYVLSMRAPSKHAWSHTAESGCRPSRTYQLVLCNTLASIWSFH